MVRQFKDFTRKPKLTLLRSLPTKRVPNSKNFYECIINRGRGVHFAVCPSAGIHYVLITYLTCTTVHSLRTIHCYTAWCCMLRSVSGRRGRESAISNTPRTRWLMRIKRDNTGHYVPGPGSTYSGHVLCIYTRARKQIRSWRTVGQATLRGHL